MQQSFFIEYGSLISASAVILANLLAIWFAVRNTRKQITQAVRHFKSQIELNKKFETFRLLMDLEKKVVDVQKTFHKLSRSGELNRARDEQLLDLDGDFPRIRELANIYEAIAIGVKERTLDKYQVKDYWRSDYVRTWLRLKHLVLPQRLKRRTPKLYVNFQELAEEWLIQDDISWFDEYHEVTQATA